jgi:hypothetical protein
MAEKYEHRGDATERNQIRKQGRDIKDNCAGLLKKADDRRCRANAPTGSSPAGHLSTYRGKGE